MRRTAPALITNTGVRTVLVKTSDLKPGMVIQEDVMLPSGSILINARQRLTEQLINTVERRGVDVIQIVPAEEPAEADAAADTAPSDGGKRQEPAAPIQRLPGLELQVAPDLMSAKLKIEPLQNSLNELKLQDILDFLDNRELTFGTNYEAINQFLEKWNKFKKFYEIDNIARGVFAQPGREGPLEFHVTCLNGDETIKKAHSFQHVWELTAENIAADRVLPGQVIAEKKIAQAPIPGMNIKGQALVTEEIVSAPITLDPTVEYDKSGKKIVSRATGIAYFDETGRIGIIPINFDGKAEVRLEEGNMKAVLVLHPAGEGGSMPGKSDIQQLMAQQNVTTGVRQAVLDKVCDQLAKGLVPEKEVVIAEGIPATNGENGRVELLINVETSLKLKENPDGSVDYKNVKIVNSVAKGAELARLIPPEHGRPGRDVTGKEIAAKDGIAAKLPVGTNTVISKQNPDVLLAATDGNARYNNSVIEISEGFVVRGNIDYSTGNVKYAKSVTVNGDVRTGFTVECGGDLQVNGIIEDATIIVGGNVLVKHGFVGQGKGLIDGRGNVNIGFMKNQTIKSWESVVIAREALNANIFARKSIMIHGNPLSAAGGRLVARDSISVFTVGNSSGIKTQLEVGVDFLLIDELEKAQKQAEEVSDNLRKIFETYKKYENQLKIRHKLSPKDQMLFTKLRETLIKYQQQLKTLEERTEIIKSKTHKFDTSYIKIEHGVLPGTIIKIGERHMLVKEEIIGPKTVRLINFEIRVI